MKCACVIGDVVTIYSFVLFLASVTTHKRKTTYHSTCSYSKYFLHHPTARMAAAPISPPSTIYDQLKRRRGEKYYPPHFNYVETPTERLDYFLVLDFEGVINKDRGSPDVMEIIEFPVLKINARTLETESVFHTYVQPVIHQKLNPVCTEITGITQEMVDGQPTLSDTLTMLDEWMRKESLLEKGVNICFVTCGDWDLKKGLPVNCDYLGISYPDYLKKWINIKSYFQTIVGKKGHSMKTMLQDLKLTLDGRHHSGIDDSKNIAKILLELAKQNERLAQGLVEPRVLKEN